MNGHELSDAFQRILPEQPSAGGWAGRARRRSQHRRRMVGAAAVAVVVAFAIPMGLHLGAGPQVMTTPAPTATPQPEREGMPTPCQEAADKNFEGTDPVDGKLPEGATKLWLCGEAYPRLPYGGQLAFIGPQEALTVGVDEAVSAFNDLTWQEGAAIDCASSGEVYHLLVEYPDQKTQTLEGNFAPDGCQHFRMSSGIVEGADGYVATLQDLWEAQRESTDPVQLDVTMCPGYTSLFSMDPADLGHGHGCVLQRKTTAGGAGATMRSDDLPADLLTLVRDKVSSGGEPLSRFGAFSSDEQIVLLSPHNDPVTLSWGTWGRAAGLMWNNPERRVWYPDAAQAQRLDDYFAQLRRNPDAEPEPTLGPEDTGGLTPKVCADIRDGTLAPDQLPAGDRLPVGAERVWLCGDLNARFGGQLGLREPLVVDPDRVVDAINQLEPMPAREGDGCTEVGGVTYHLAIDYPDGRRRVISAETVNCRWVGGWGGRVGGDALLEAIAPMWTEQRATHLSSDLGEPRLCDGYPRSDTGEPRYPHTFLPVDRAEATSGALCGLPSDSTDFDGDVVQRWLPPALVTAIAEATPTPGAPEDMRLTAGLPSIVLLNAFGDPLVLAVGEGGVVYLGEEGGAWMPSGPLADEWQEALSGLRTTPFYVAPPECGGYDPATLTGDLSRVVGGLTCLGQFAVPAKGPDLEPAFATELARRFAAESTKATLNGWNTANFLVLTDADGKSTRLYWNGRNPAHLVDEMSERSWPIPGDVQRELERYGFDFTPE
ncbi:hypothetical protein [Tessaracoccus antarcticus]|uniref:Uncharacterized protein n=1 Tax=Tessaracoccus antarcticus TaxID=2479848 RepID=A0A3M0GAN8_9ACTN|nr:hypothetical protein [Tessaracoccus antarcticus]RMB62041.1 hypothetical protein EAX62_05500 [Tessaracoccus antarcticus]